ncbi:hypothetical protein [Mycobacterium intracellulare]|uniref:hypothetical protein n=1 Tax=Mycobacterium intracellulare TaxID=1767 RepID=UPI00109E44E0|nr:hypothetical protein [Mycobacterium intracellulare]
MTQQLFIAWSGLTNDLTAPLSGVSVGSTTKTVQQIVAPANAAMSIKEWGYAILGTSLPTTPIQLELVTTGSVYATVTPGNVANYSNTGGQPSQVQGDTVQVVSFGTPSAGSAVLNFGGQSTTSVAYNATASTVQTDMQALSNVGAGNATVTGSTGGPYTITFASSVVPTPTPITITSSLTGGTPTVSGTHTGFNATAEGSILSTRLLAMRAYPADWSAQYPLSDEPMVTNGHALRIRGTSPGGTVTIATYVKWVEGA